MEETGTVNEASKLTAPLEDMKKYDASFLLGLRFSASSTKKPDNLPDFISNSNNQPNSLIRNWTEPSQEQERELKWDPFTDKETEDAEEAMKNGMVNELEAKIDFFERINMQLELETIKKRSNILRDPELFEEFSECLVLHYFKGIITLEYLCKELKDMNRGCTFHTGNKQYYRLVRDSHLSALDYTDKVRFKAGLLFTQLIKQCQLSKISYSGGLASALQIKKYDKRPKLYEFFAQMIVPLVYENAISLYDLTCMVSFHAKTNFIMEPVIAPLFKLIINSKRGYVYLKNLWDESGVEMTDFIPSDKVDRFVRENNLGFLICDKSIQKYTRIDGDQHGRIESRFLKFFNTGAPTEIIEKWIAKKISEGIEDNIIARAMVKAKYKYSININEEKFNRYNGLMKKHIEDRQTYQLHSIYALHSVINDLEGDLDLPNKTSVPMKVKKEFEETETEHNFPQQNREIFSKTNDQDDEQSEDMEECNDYDDYLDEQ